VFKHLSNGDPTSSLPGLSTALAAFDSQTLTQLIEFFLDLGCQQPQVHDLRYPGSCDVTKSTDFGVVMDVAVATSSRHLVASSLGNDLAFELGEGQQDIEHQPVHRVCRIELLSNAYKCDVLTFKDLEHLCKVHQ